MCMFDEESINCAVIALAVIVALYLAWKLLSGYRGFSGTPKKIMGMPAALASIVSANSM